VTIAPRDGLVREAGGQVAVGYGIEIGYFAPDGHSPDLEPGTAALIRQFEQSNAAMRSAREARKIEVGGRTALLSTLHSRSPYRGEQEVDALVTVARPEGLFYMVFIAPQSVFDSVQGTFEDVVRSVQFR
jgi:hypothetical protein